LIVRLVERCRSVQTVIVTVCVQNRGIEGRPLELEEDFDLATLEHRTKLRTYARSCLRCRRCNHASSCARADYIAKGAPSNWIARHTATFPIHGVGCAWCCSLLRTRGLGFGVIWRRSGSGRCHWIYWGGQACNSGGLKAHSLLAIHSTMHLRRYGNVS
jgi:hypothetical protein